jgi:Mce-associated membrane protein
MTRRTRTLDVFEQVADDPEGIDDGEQVADLPSSEEESEVAEVTDVSEEDADAEAVVEATPRRRVTRRTMAAAVVLLLLVGALGTSGFLGWRLWEQNQIAAASQAGLQAAQDYAVVLTSLDAKDIDGNYHRALDGATGEFKDAYSQGSAQLRQILIDNKASGRGIVVSSAVKSATKTKVEVLLFVDQSITNAAISSPRIDRNRIDMTMELIDGRWLASKVEIL